MNVNTRKSYEDIVRGLRRKLRKTGGRKLGGADNSFDEAMLIGLESHLAGDLEQAYLSLSEVINLRSEVPELRKLRMDVVTDLLKKKSHYKLNLSFDEIMEDFEYMKNHDEDYLKIYNENHFWLIYLYNFTYKEISKHSDYEGVLESLERKYSFDKLNKEENEIEYNYYKGIVSLLWGGYISRKHAIKCYEKANLCFLNILAIDPYHDVAIKLRLSSLIDLFTENHKFFEDNSAILKIIINIVKVELRKNIKNADLLLEYTVLLNTVLINEISDKNLVILKLIRELCMQVDEINENLTKCLAMKGVVVYYEGLFLDKVNLSKYYSKALELFYIAQEKDPKCTTMLLAWASCSSSYALELPLPNRPKIYASIFEKYRKAVIINPGNCCYYHSWANTIIEFALDAEDDLKQRYYKQASQKYLMSLEIGAPSYGLCRAYALLGDQDEALNLLKERLEEEDVHPQTVIEDRAWQHYLKNSQFIEIIRKFQPTFGT